MASVGYFGPLSYFSPFCFSTAGPASVTSAYCARMRLSSHAAVPRNTHSLLVSGWAPRHVWSRHHLLHPAHRQPARPRSAARRKVYSSATCTQKDLPDPKSPRRAGARCRRIRDLQEQTRSHAIFSSPSHAGASRTCFAKHAVIAPQETQDRGHARPLQIHPRTRDRSHARRRLHSATG